MNKIEIVSDGSRLMSYTEHERIRRNRRLGIGIAVVLVVISLFLAYWFRSFNSYEEIRYTQNTEGNGTRYEVFLQGYLKYSKDGISYLSQKDEVQWTEAFTMGKPLVVSNGQYAVAADMDGNLVHLFDRNGKVGEFSMTHPIKKILLAKQGVFCVVLDGMNENYIRLFDTKGVMLAEIKTKIENNGYPMAVALSSDASKLVASYYRVDGIDSQNIVSFYNFGEGGKGQSGNLVGTYQMDNMLIPKVAFTDDDTVYVVGDSRMLVYDVKDIPKQKKEILYPANPINIFNNEDYIGFTCENPIEEVEAEKAEPYEIYVYTKNGNLLKHFGAAAVYDNVKMIDNLIAGFTGNVCSIIRTNGMEMFYCDMGKNIVDILPTNSRTEFLFVYSESSARIRLENIVKLAEDTETVEIEE
ncbi:MAG: hypothetical protein E7253_06200 [Lachnospiraceae bacterium]|nr:hypothetical protein [Lachnospiraceae bacterium]